MYEPIQPNFEALIEDNIESNEDNNSDDDDNEDDASAQSSEESENDNGEEGEISQEEDLRRATRTTRGHRVFLEPTNEGKSHGEKSNFMQYGDKNHQYFHMAVGIAFTQMQEHVGIKKHGNRAIEAMMKEFKQLDKGAVPGKPVVEGIDPNLLTNDEKQRA